MNRTKLVQINLFCLLLAKFFRRKPMILMHIIFHGVSLAMKWVSKMQHLSLFPGSVRTKGDFYAF